MNHYEAKQEARRARLEAAADRAERRAAAAYKRADLREEVSGIPFGQPILVGHHSERRHRAAIERADRAMRASIEEGKRARDLRARADAVGSGGISSDDPDAAEKIRAQIARHEEYQRVMRECNKALRAALKAAPELAERGPDCAAFAGYLAKLEAIVANFPASTAAAMLKPDACGRRGYADFQLANNSANIRRLKARLASIEREAARRETAEAPAEREVNGVRVIENADENRLQLIFPGKPDGAMRARLKSAGFRWAPSAGAWQRQLNNGARWAAERVLSEA